MTRHDEMDRTIRAWFQDDAGLDAPAHLLDTVLGETRRHHSRPAWLAAMRADGAVSSTRIAGMPSRPVALLAIAALILLALVGAAILVGGSARRVVVVTPTATPAPTPYVAPEPTLTVSGGSLPRVVIPAGYQPRLTPGDLERHVLVLITENERELGSTMAPPKVAAITLVPPGASVPLTWSDGSNPGGVSFRRDTLSWAVEAEGTLLECDSRCSVFTLGTFFFDDASEAYIQTGARGPSTPIPSTPFRSWLADFGQQFTPTSVPPAGVLAATSVLARLTPADLPAPGARPDPPIYGLVTCVDPSKHCADALATPGKTAAIWWIGFPNTRSSDGGPAWITVNAATGEYIIGSPQ